MKITNDILKDYFYDKCSHEEEIEIQKWLTENDNSLVDQSFREIISEIQMENSELSQKAFEYSNCVCHRSLSSHQTSSPVLWSPSAAPQLHYKSC